ncbi:hypothetical protein [Deinococcus soli (ex Cha et al. 2016)]|uniref:Uncharacterized protein n=2 Tax=Deinococcus soli (ex Cha et al. 2016) TaxID=1309411 RepID=A0ACC6KKE7_9DEIO|nr:hypothetical protein [Deinococcus soli (ex Cha et al. 2016)]MDR6218590.1 hypothetical protein [Deinococcus soli (ex Cha et al. 2016)]MDR6328387.1 hypothetical protein [Deinococcus soli (ex Cha et al. 2016)]MDR6752998.1 hypothetical protein [Deinococcus soli (ex Cha et al. 2016)]
MKIYIARFGMNGCPDVIAASADEDKVVHAAIGAVITELTAYGSPEARRVVTLWENDLSSHAYDEYRRSNLDLRVTPVLVESVPWLA